MSKKIVPGSLERQSYAQHWAVLKKLGADNPRFEESWNAIMRLEALFDWTGLLRTLRKDNAVKNR